jgi:flagellar secretion chaperone FliS
MSAAALKKYASSTVDTVAPGRLVVMLYDRLALDLERAEAALVANDYAEAHHQLVHAQDIVTELHGSLDPEKWAPAVALAAVYSYVFDELVNANVAKDAARVRQCREVVEPLRDAWSQAAGLGATPSAAAQAA